MRHARNRDCLAAVLLSLAAIPCSAQTTNTVQPLGANTQTQEGPARIELSFPGGNLESFVAALREAAGEAAVNIVMPQQARELEVPPLELRGVTVHGAVRSLELAFGDDSPYRLGVREIDPIGPVFGVEVARFNPFGGRSAPLQQTLDVISVADMLEKEGKVGGISADVLLSSVETALRMSPTSTDGADESLAPEIRFHEQGGLLIVKGLPQEVSIVRQTLSELRGSVLQNASQSQVSERYAARTEYMKRRAELAVRAAEQELNLAQSGLDRARLMHEKGHIPDGELANHEARVNRARHEFDKAMLEAEFEPRLVEPDNVNETVQRLQAENEELRNQIAALQQALANLQGQMQNKGGGRAR